MCVCVLARKTTTYQKHIPGSQFGRNSRLADSILSLRRIIWFWWKSGLVPGRRLIHIIGAVLSTHSFMSTDEEAWLRLWSHLYINYMGFSTMLRGILA